MENHLENEHARSLLRYRLLNAVYAIRPASVLLVKSLSLLTKLGPGGESHFSGGIYFGQDTY